jgi:2-amino-4-hydroxy-6-hydroxymethyldihydropteridine diphosphokinase
MIILALGSNQYTTSGSPESTLCRAVFALRREGISVNKLSKIYKTEAYSYLPQPDYVNAAVLINTPLPPHVLLRMLKRLEADAGRRSGPDSGRPYYNWRPRPLDIDIVSYKGLIRNWNGCKPVSKARVILPHPRAHLRAFVLKPVADVAPEWHHPVFGLTAQEFLKRPEVQNAGRIIGSSEFSIPVRDPA